MLGILIVKHGVARLRGVWLSVSALDMLVW